MTGKKEDELHCGLVSFSILWPEKNATGKDVNEEAMVMELSFGEFQMLFTGDIGADTEKKLLASGILKDVDCLKVGHHGSRYSTTEAFLEKIKPELFFHQYLRTSVAGNRRASGSGRKPGGIYHEKRCHYCGNRWKKA